MTEAGTDHRSILVQKGQRLELDSARRQTFAGRVASKLDLNRNWGRRRGCFRAFPQRTTPQLEPGGRNLDSPQTHGFKSASTA